MPGSCAGLRHDTMVFVEETCWSAVSGGSRGDAGASDSWQNVELRQAIPITNETRTERLHPPLGGTSGASKLVLPFQKEDSPARCCHLPWKSDAFLSPTVFFHRPKPSSNLDRSYVRSGT